MIGARPLARCLVILSLTGASAASAEPPPPLNITAFPLYGFPGSFAAPSSAASTALGLSDRWLGEEPFDNPAAAPPGGIMLAPALLSVRRQDLAGRYVDYDATPAYFDAAGGWLAVPLWKFTVSLYACQPVLRLEDEAFTTPPGDVPAQITSTSVMRETRAGLAVSRAWGGTRLGAALEGTWRDDSYDCTEVSGDPYAGKRHADFSGSGLGFQLGVRASPLPRLAVGAGLRRVPALDLTGSRSGPWETDLPVAISATRSAAWEGGVSARFAVTEEFRVLASLGGRTAQEWEGFGVTSGRALGWSLGLDYHQAEAPWSVRCGLGQEQQCGVPEPRANLLSLGLGWDLSGLFLDVGAARRLLARGDGPESFDDRVVVGLTVPF